MNHHTLGTVEVRKTVMPGVKGPCDASGVSYSTVWRIATVPQVEGESSHSGYSISKENSDAW